MTTRILNVSIPQELAVFLDDNSALSPSKILQAALFNLKDQALSYKQELMRANNVIKKLEGIIQDLNEKK